MLSILKTAYKEFAEQLGEIKPARGAKRDLVLTGIERMLQKMAKMGFPLVNWNKFVPGLAVIWCAQCCGSSKSWRAWYARAGGLRRSGARNRVFKSCLANG